MLTKSETTQDLPFHRLNEHVCCMCSMGLVAPRDPSCTEAYAWTVWSPTAVTENKSSCFLRFKLYRANHEDCTTYSILSKLKHLIKNKLIKKNINRTSPKYLLIAIKRFFSVTYILNFTIFGVVRQLWLSINGIKQEDVFLVHCSGNNTFEPLYEAFQKIKERTPFVTINEKIAI